MQRRKHKKSTDEINEEGKEGCKREGKEKRHKEGMGECEEEENEEGKAVGKKKCNLEGKKPIGKMAK